MTVTANGLDELKGMVGTDLGHTGWLEITQDRVDALSCPGCRVQPGSLNPPAYASPRRPVQYRTVRRRAICNNTFARGRQGLTGG